MNCNSKFISGHFSCKYNLKFAPNLHKSSLETIILLIEPRYTNPPPPPPPPPHPMPISICDNPFHIYIHIPLLLFFFICKTTGRLSGHISLKLICYINRLHSMNKISADYFFFQQISVTDFKPDGF